MSLLRCFVLSSFLFAAACSSSTVDVASASSGAGGDSTATSSNVVVATATTGAIAATSSTSTGGGAGGADLAAASSSSTVTPANCDALGDCGNFGEGCVACAIQAACATEYANCANDPACQAYASCVTDCPSKSDSCVLGCASQSPGGSDTFKSLNQCVVCQACVTSCADATDPTVCD